MMTLKEKQILQEIFRMDVDQVYSYYARLDPALRTEAVTYKAANIDPCCLQYAPKESLSERVIQLICNRNPNFIQLINPAHLTETICLRAIETRPESYWAIPQEKRTMAFYEKMLEKNGIFYQNFPLEIKQKPSLVKKALQEDKECIHYIPAHLLTDTFYLSTARKIPYVISTFPPTLQKEEIYKELIQKDRKQVVLRFIPENLRSRNLCRIALEQFLEKPKLLVPVLFTPYPDLIAGTLEKLGDTKLIKRIFSALDHSQKTEEVVKTALSKVPECICYLPPQFYTAEHCKKILEERPDLIMWLRGQNRTPELCLIACLTNPKMKQYVPDQVNSQDNLYSFALQHIPEKSPSSLTFEQLKGMYEISKNPVMTLAVKSKEREPGEKTARGLHPSGKRGIKN